MLAQIALAAYHLVRHREEQLRIHHQAAFRAGEVVRMVRLAQAVDCPGPNLLVASAANRSGHTSKQALWTEQLKILEEMSRNIYPISKFALI